MIRILVVDDDPQILRALRINLRARQYEVAVAPDGTQALRQAIDWRPDLVVLDLGLPDIDGVEVIHGLRGWTQVPIVVLSGRSGSQDKVDALDAGADDYVTKPFGIDELLARVRAVTRRVPIGEEAATVRVGRYLVDLANKIVRACVNYGGPEDDVHLTPTEWQLLEILLRNPGKLITHRQLLTEVWGGAYLRETHYLRQYMAQLRRKLETDPTHPRHLLTGLGMGYRFQP
ncbi:MAG TPA: response regulator [Mycobacteriales bacterium]|nr:response regulator [Mycobacteriales bacterium]